MKDLIRKMNSVDVGALFKKKTPNKGPTEPNGGGSVDNTVRQTTSIDWQSAPKPLLTGVIFGGLLVAYGFIGLFQLYSAYTNLSDSELRWVQANQEQLYASQQLEAMIENNKKLIDENSLFINGKSELEKNIYLFHKSAGLEIKKSNEEVVGGRKYSNYFAEGDFSGIQSVLRNMNSISMHASINMINITVLQEKNKLEFQMQLSYTDITPLKSVLGVKKMSFMDGSAHPTARHQYQRVQFSPLKNPVVQAEAPKVIDMVKRDPFFKPELTNNELLSAPVSSNTSASKEVSLQDQQDAFIVLRGCITAEILRQCIYELPNNKVIFRKNGEDVSAGMRQMEISHDSVKLRKGEKILIIPVGGQIHE